MSVLICQPRYREVFQAMLDDAPVRMGHVKGFVDDDGRITSIEGHTTLLPGDLIYIDVGVSAEVIQHVPDYPNAVIQIMPPSP